MGIEFRGKIRPNEAWRTKEFQEKEPLPERIKNAQAWSSIQVDGNRERTTLYAVGETTYALVKGRQGQPDRIFLDPWRNADPNAEPTLIEDQSIIEGVLAQAKEDDEILNAREELAAREAGDNEILKDILDMHLSYNRGRIQPDVDEESGVTFYQVGRNASHEFYAGEKDGQKYIMSFGEDGWDDDKDEPIWKKNVHKTDEWGYMGHH